MAFRYTSEVDDDRARALRGVIKNNDGLWRSDRQARWARGAMQIRTNAFYDIDENYKTIDLEAEYDDGSDRNIVLEQGQIFTKWQGSVTFQVRHDDFEHTGRVLGEGGYRPVEHVFVLDGVGVVLELKLHFALERANSWKTETTGRWLPVFDKTEILFERTASGADHWAQQDTDRAEVLRKRAEEDADAEDAPTGRVEVRGEVLSTKYQDSDYGTTKKMLVRAEAGWKLWTTVPSAILETDRGDQVHIKVTVTPSDDDSKFAFGKRPAAVKS